MFKLDNQEIKRPLSMTITPIETANLVNTLGGKTRKDILHLKNQYILNYELINQTDATTIYNIFTANDVVRFQSTDSGKLIDTTVVISFSDRVYTTGGEDYLESFSLILTEES